MSKIDQRYNDGGNLFITVGSTSFQGLNDVVEDNLRWLLRRFNKIIFQHGSVPITKKSYQLVAANVEWPSESGFHTRNYINNIESLYKNADMVVSHGGAGSIRTSLIYKKKTMVISNPALLDNHQLELARRLEKDNLIVFGSCDSFKKDIIYTLSWTPKFTDQKDIERIQNDFVNRFILNL